MKTMTCRELGGVCGAEFQADTFEEIAEQSRQHGAEMAAMNDESHLTAMNEMKQLMQDPSKAQAWMKNKKQEFDNLPED